MFNKSLLLVSLSQFIVYVGCLLGLSLAIYSKNDGFISVPFPGFFDSQDSDLAKNFKKAADAMSEKHRFAYSVNEEVNKKHGYFK